MELETIGIISPGEMGSAIGRYLINDDHRVITCLTGRSERTKQFSIAAGIQNVPTLHELVIESDLILSIMVPSEAEHLAESVSSAFCATGENTYFADCNAVSPKTSIAIGSIISKSGGRYIDAGIIGGPPTELTSPRFYVSGPHHQAMKELDGSGIQIKPLGDEIGRASAIKMCYASLTKGTWALYIALLTTAELLGLSDELKEEFAFSQPQTLRTMESRLASIPSKAERWIGEMEEIADTFADQGVTPFFHRGSAEIYRLIGRSRFASELVGNSDESRNLSETISALSDLISSEHS